ncbi:hypothetical protein Syun_026166 [Stephania yunnanensis]|uniref:Myb/SANT-like domain-containing protein n=1 Tax=Stephania yunnanensis TaxID=152371 RepID=A0AAP0HWF9_9MAGN
MNRTHSISNSIKLGFVGSSSNFCGYNGRAYATTSIVSAIFEPFGWDHVTKSRWKWFKDHYRGYIELLRCNSRFGWDHVTKKFTSSDEAWETYFKIIIAVGNAIASGRYSIGLEDDIDARTFELEEPSDDVLEDLTYDYDAEAFVQRSCAFFDSVMSGLEVREMVVTSTMEMICDLFLHHNYTDC